MPTLENDPLSTPALPAMARWLQAPRSQSWLAQKLLVSRPTVYRWCAGEHVPDPHYRHAIEDLSDGAVRFEDWYTDEQLRVACKFAASGAFAGKMKRRRASRSPSAQVTP